MGRRCDLGLIGPAYRSIQRDPCPSANLSGAILIRANLSNAKDLTQTQLDAACGADAKLPPGLTLKPCPDDWERRPPPRAPRPPSWLR
jgi:uncharacterized protein YjbI with pentapeptide repeats